MADNSAIEWTEATWNPVTGCEEVSPGCAHCYAETFAARWRGIPGHPYEQGFALKLWPQRLEQPLKWSRPRMIFVNSMSDLLNAPAGLASKPVAQACRRVVGVLVHQPVELGDHTPDGSRASAGVAAGVSKHETMMGLASLVVIVGDDTQVGDVLRDDGALLGLGQREQIRIRQCTQLSALDHRVGIVSASAELLGDSWRVHLVEHEFHDSGERLLRALPRGVLPLRLFAVEDNPRVHLLGEVAVVPEGHVDLCV
jgi:hypothetical protein